MNRQLVNWFSTLEPGLQQLLNSKMVSQKLAAGQLLYRQDDPGDCFYRVVSGRIRLSTLTPDGKELLVALCGPGHCVGVMSVVDELPRSTNALAEVQTVVGRLRAQDFNAIADVHPAVNRALLRCYTTWLRHNSLGHTSLRSIQERMASRLVFLMEMALAETVNAPGSQVELQITQEGLASAMGVTRQAINRHLKSWRDSGIIDYRQGTLVLLDVAALRDAAAGTFATTEPVFG